MSATLHPGHIEPIGGARGAAPSSRQPSAAPLEEQRSTARRELVAISIGLAAVGACAVEFELAERLSAFVRPRERFQLDELIIVVFVAALAMAWFAWRRVQEARAALQRQQRVEDRLAGALAENRRYAMGSVQRQEAQSRQLARELHDELGQMLYAIKLDALAAAGAPQRSRARVHLEAIGAHVDQLQQVVRAMLQRLRPVGLDELGLTAALEACVQGWRTRLPHVCLTLALDDGLDGLDEATNITLYRVIQESLTNCARHAQATRIDIGITAGARPGAAGGGGLVLTVHDDGIGPMCDPAVPAAHAGFGLLGMRERVEALGGTFSAAVPAAHPAAVPVPSARGPGFRIEARLPCGTRGGGTAAKVATAHAVARS